ncbi:hypothetical protein CWI38_0071p0030 [Hamiltosporidium tvaerminnensis]|uniref:ARID domain-containing protein n=1 Tax=Hamiltosporidium tvaerminnensis TaxID=1176355 RepID=A0A4Q9M162_9MICR|nr:hypothetical protein CWI38_0071p0030 [Hamiltosporidium tvaerminnensis]
MKISPYPEKVLLNKYYFLRTRSELLLRIIYIVEEISPVKYVGILIDKEDKFKNKKILVDKKCLLIFHPKTRLFQHLMSIPEFRSDVGIRRTLCVLGFPVDKIMIKMENKNFDTSDCEISASEFENEYSKYLKYDESGPFLSGNTFITDPLKLVVPGVNSLNVYRLYVIVCKNGGMERITNDQKWKPLFYSEMKKTNVSYTVRTFYKKYLYEFEYLRRIKIRYDLYKNRIDSCKSNPTEDKESSKNNEIINEEVNFENNNLNEKLNKVCEVSEQDINEKLKDKNNENTNLRIKDKNNEIKNLRITDRTDENKNIRIKDKNNEIKNLRITDRTDENKNIRIKDKNNENKNIKINGQISNEKFKNKNLVSDAIITRISIEDNIFNYKYKPYQVVMLITENGERYYGVIKLRRNKGLNMYYVQFVGWNKEYNEWYCEDVLEGVIIGNGGCKLSVEDIFIAMGNKKPSRSSKANYLIDDPLIREKHCHNVSKVGDRKDSEGSDSDRGGGRVLNMYGEKGFRDRRYDPNMEVNTENIKGVKYRGVSNKGVLDRGEWYGDYNRVLDREEGYCVNKGVLNNREEWYGDYNRVLDREEGYCVNKGVLNNREEWYGDYNRVLDREEGYPNYNRVLDREEEYSNYNRVLDMEEGYSNHNRVLDREEGYGDYNRVLDTRKCLGNFKGVLNHNEGYSNYNGVLDREEYYGGNKGVLNTEEKFVDYKGVLHDRSPYYNIKGGLNRNDNVSSTLNYINTHEQEIKDLNWKDISNNEKYGFQNTNIYSKLNNMNITNLRKDHPSGMNISKEKKISSDKSNSESSCLLIGNKRNKSRLSEEKPMPTINYVKKYFRWFKGDWDTEEMRNFMACVGLNGVNDLNENNYMFMK